VDELQNRIQGEANAQGLLSQWAYRRRVSKYRECPQTAVARRQRLAAPAGKQLRNLQEILYVRPGGIDIAVSDDKPARQGHDNFLWSSLRDNVPSPAQNQCRKHCPAVLRCELQEALQPVRSAALWATINSETAAFGETRMAGRYLRVHYEKLCSDPRSTIGEMLRFLESHDLEPDDEMLGEVVPPGSIGRWRHLGEPTIMEWIDSVAGEALQRFGYC